MASAVSALRSNTTRRICLSWRRHCRGRPTTGCRRCRAGLVGGQRAGTNQPAPVELGGVAHRQVAVAAQAALAGIGEARLVLSTAAPRSRPQSPDHRHQLQRNRAGGHRRRRSGRHPARRRGMLRDQQGRERARQLREGTRSPPAWSGMQAAAAGPGATAATSAPTRPTGGSTPAQQKNLEHRHADQVQPVTGHAGFHLAAAAHAVPGAEVGIDRRFPQAARAERCTRTPDQQFRPPRVQPAQVEARDRLETRMSAPTTMRRSMNFANAGACRICTRRSATSSIGSQQEPGVGIDVAQQRHLHRPTGDLPRPRSPSAVPGQGHDPSSAAESQPSSPGRPPVAQQAEQRASVHQREGVGGVGRGASC